VKYAPVNAPLAPSALTVTAFSTFTKLEWQAGSDNARELKGR